GAKIFLEPGSYAPDSLTNYEIGLKTQLFDHRLQVNLSAYWMDWDNVQFFLFDPPAKINTTFGLNGPSYNVKGAEFQIVGRVTPELTLFASGSYNHATESAAPCLKGNIPGTAYYGACIMTYQPSGSGVAGENTPFPNPFGELGSVPAFSPAFQGNIRARYDWQIGDYKAFVQVGGNYVSGMWNQPASYELGALTPLPTPTTTNLRYYQPAYGTIDASIGLTADHWRVELFGTNLANSHASTFTSSGQFIRSEVPLRPLVVGLKVGANF
ncbi:MAG TPA: TonB-dependent receptor, partial [Caulobacteraceae bacterium]